MEALLHGRDDSASTSDIDPGNAAGRSLSPASLSPPDTGYRRATREARDKIKIL
jgi:hypothetical protein